MARRIELTLGAGEEATVPLGGAGSVGYGWQLSVEGDGSAEAEIRAASVPPAFPGGSAPLTLHLRALHPGRTLFRLRLRRAFGPERPPLDEVEVEVTVP